MHASLIARRKPAIFVCPGPACLSCNFLYVHGGQSGTLHASFHACVQVCAALVEPTDAFFDKVFVMCDDEGMRRNRLALLRDIAALPSGIINFAELPGF